MNKRNDKQSGSDDYADLELEDWLESSHPEAVRHRVELAKISNAIEGFEETPESIAFMESLPVNVSDEEFIERFRKYKNL